MKGSIIWGLVITLLLGCWVGSASARLLTADDALLVPYYEVGSNLATIIGVQNVADSTLATVINVTVYDGDDGTVVPDGRADICLDEDEFGYVVLQSARPTAGDTDRGVHFSVAEDGISSIGFVTLAYGGTRERCAQGAGTTAVDVTTDGTMIAWTILQDIGSGFFATEIPVVEMDWAMTVDAVPGTDERDAELNAYCYSNTDRIRAIDTTTGNEVNTVLNSNSALRCNNAATHTYVPANTALPALPAVPAIAPSVAIPCAGPDGCPGLANSDATERPWVAARFDVSRANSTTSDIYLWLDTAPGGVEIRDGDTLGISAETADLLSVVCEDGMETDAEIDDIDISGHVNVINPRSLGCSGRGILRLKLPRRSEGQDYCYPRGEARAEAQTNDGSLDPHLNVLDDRNNRCNSFTRVRNDNQADTTASDAYYCYNSTVINSRNTDTNLQTPVLAHRVTAAEITNPSSSTPDRVTDCKRFTYVPDVRADNPNGFIFSHVSQASDHFRTGFQGYTYTE